MTLNISVILLLAATSAYSAADRLPANVDYSRLTALPGHLHPNARPEFDRGPADPDTPIVYATLYLRPADGLESFLSFLQNPSSPAFHKWLTPEQFADRFGLSGSDLGKVTAWLRASGFTVHDVARGRHWITFSTTAAQASRAFRTEFHHYLVDGETHFANSTDLSVPAALEPVIAGVGGLTDFVPQPMHRAASPQFNRGSSHDLVPDDLATIYNIAPLYKQGIDGTGQTIAIVGTSDINLSDIATYRAHFNLPANAPQVVLYGPDPGFVSGGQTEANIDLELAGAVARNATLIYVNSTSVNNAAAYAVDQNVAPVMSMSYGGCELYLSQAVRSIAQQAVAQGITWMVSSGDSAAATCDRSSPTPQATKGQTVSTPASFPEVTAVGGTEFNEGTGTYWSGTNSATFASALSFIPERVWNDSALQNGLIGGGGGASAYYSKPSWQTGPGVPADNARDVPDVSLSASADHDGFYLYNQGSYQVWGGTSASSPLFAGIVALLNHSLAVANPKTPVGLGNINPALYQLAQATTDVFHDTTAGDNIVPCAQGSPDCVNGVLGFAAAPGYDRASGLGSVDASRLIAEWNTGKASTTTLLATPSAIGPTDTVMLTATVTGPGALPTGNVTFVAEHVILGTAALTAGNKVATATLSVPSTSLTGGNLIAGAQYSGDSNYLASSGSLTLKLNPPASGSWVVAAMTPNPVNESGTSWPYTLTLTELAEVATKVTAFTVNGVNNISNFPNPNIAAHGSLSVSLTGNGLTVPLNRDFHFEGTDTTGGATWQQDLIVPFIGPLGPTRLPGITLSVSPAVMQQNPAADPSCQWSQQLTVQETGGYQTTLLSLLEGSHILNSSLVQAFGTLRLAPLGVLTGTMCYASATAPSTATYSLIGVSELGSGVSATATASFAAPSAKPTSFAVSAPSVSIPLTAGTQTGSASLSLTFGAGSPAWTATVAPASEKWLTVSALSGTGNTTLQLQASASGLSNGVYNAMLSIQAQDVLPQSIQVPIALLVGASSGMSIGGIGNAASGAQSYAPGQLLAVYGTNLAASLQIAGIQPLPLTMASASATVNGVSAPLWFVSSTQINLQIPYETAAGPAVLAVNNGGQVASSIFNVSPAAPGIFAYNGSLVPYATAKQGQTILCFITGDGDVTPSLATGVSPASGTALAQLPKSRQNVSLTIAGEPATIVFNGIVPGLIGVTQVNFTVPTDAAIGVDPVVVTVGGAASAPVNLTVTAGSM